jgi:hypothetical protein
LSSPYCCGVPRDGALSGARLIEGLLRPAVYPVVGVFRDDALSLFPLARVFGSLGWPIVDVSVLDESVLVVPSDWAPAAIGKHAIATVRMTILFIGLSS